MQFLKYMILKKAFGEEKACMVTILLMDLGIQYKYPICYLY